MADRTDGIRRLSEVVDLQWPTISLMAHRIKQGGQRSGLGNSIASFGHDRKKLWQVGASWLTMGTVVSYDGIRHLSGLLTPRGQWGCLRGSQTEVIYDGCLS
jgi:hypothetical protein